MTLISGFNVYAQAFVLASDAQGAPGRQVRVLVLDMLENSFRNYASRSAMRQRKRSCCSPSC